LRGENLHVARGIADALPGARVLPGRFNVVQMAIGVRKRLRRRFPPWLTLMPPLDDGRRSLPSQSDLFELGNDPIELLAGELTPAQCSTKVGPI
jgi:hypothetical protein